MGAEREVTLKVGREIVVGRAQLEGSEIIVRPEPTAKRIIIKLGGATALAKGNELHVTSSGKKFVLTLGEKHATAWAAAIKNPKSVLAKLGVDKVKPSESWAIRRQHPLPSRLTSRRSKASR